MPKLDINNNEYVPPPPSQFKKGRSKRAVCFPPMSELEKEDLAHPESSVDLIDDTPSPLQVSQKQHSRNSVIIDDDSIPATTASSFVSYTDTTASIIDSHAHADGVGGDGPGPVIRPAMVIRKGQRQPQGKALEIRDTNSNLVVVNEPISSEGFSRTPPSPTRHPNEEEEKGERDAAKVSNKTKKKSEPTQVTMMHEDEDDDEDDEELDLKPEKSLGRQIRKEIWGRYDIGRHYRTPLFQRRRPRFASQVQRLRRPYIPRSKSLVSESVSGAVTTAIHSSTGSELPSTQNSRVWSHGMIHEMARNFPNMSQHQTPDDYNNNYEYDEGCGHPNPKSQPSARKNVPPSAATSVNMRNMYGPSLSSRERRNTYPHLKKVLQELQDNGALFDRVTAVEALKARIMRGDKVTHEEIKAIRHMTLPPHQRHLGWRLPWSKDLCCIKGLVHIPTPNKPAPERNTFGTMEDLRLPQNPDEVTEEHWGRRQYVVNLAGFHDDDISIYLEGKDRLVIRAVRPDVRDDLPATTVTETIVLPADLPADNLRIVRRPSGTTIIEESWRF